MPTFRTFFHATHLLFLGLWFGVLIMTSVAAAILFPTIRDLDPSLPAYAAYTEPHWRIAAGHVGNKVFLASDIIQYFCAAGTGICLVFGLLLGTFRGARRSMILRLLPLCAAMLILAYQAALLRPTMSNDLADYWQAAEQGDMETTQTAQHRFDEAHWVAEKLIGATTLCVFVAFVAGAAATPNKPSRND